MAYKNEAHSNSEIAGATINDYRFVKVGAAAGAVIQAAAATDIGCGAVEYGAASGAPVKVITGGIAKILVGVGGVTLGARVTSDATGQAVAWATTNQSYGIAKETGAAGAIVTIQLGPFPTNATVV